MKRFLLYSVAAVLMLAGEPAVGAEHPGPQASARRAASIRPLSAHAPVHACVLTPLGAGHQGGTP